jgi:membrane peptidoglycan carboxypeptidase
VSTRPPGGYDPRAYPYPTPPPSPQQGRRRASLYTQPPGGGRRGRRFKRYGPWIALILVALTSGVFGYVLWTLRDMPDPGQTPVLSRSIVIYDRKGRQIEQYNAQGQYYQELHLEDMGLMSRYATLAAEDRDFYNHPAIDVLRTASAAASDVLHRGNLQGGSTITQQLVKFAVLANPQRSVFRKMQEATIAFGLESKYSKNQILEMYLNRVFYGNNAYGIGAAVKVYFGPDKQAKDLTAGQAAFLAGIINGPSYYNPQTNYDGAKQRQLYVLDGMVKKGWLTQAEADKAAQEDIKAELKFDQGIRKSLAPHFADYVIGQLEKQFGSSAIQQGGFKVYTTIDLDLQNLAQQSVTNGVAKLKGRGVNNGDLLAANPTTGEILAWVGSADYYNAAIAGPFDVVRAVRQPGSSFKPYAFEAALKDHKITLASTVHDRPMSFAGSKPISDYDNSYLGDMSARKALLLSRNAPAVEVGWQIEGMDNVIAQAHAQGIKTELKNVPSTAIGASEVTMLEHLQGYESFANQGTMMPLFSIAKIQNAVGEDLITPVQAGSQPGISHPMTAAESYLITDTLKDYPTYWRLGWRRQMAGKSGTTGGDQTGVHNDAWMMAYNPDIVVGAWAGNTAPNGGGKSIAAFGTEVGQQVLAPFINGLPGNMKDWYKRPDGLVNGSGCQGDSSNNGNELFLQGTQGGVNCPTPTPTQPPTAPPVQTPIPTPTPSPRATIPPFPFPSPRPSPVPSPT